MNKIVYVKLTLTGVRPNRSTVSSGLGDVVKVHLEDPGIWASCPGALEATHAEVYSWDSFLDAHRGELKDEFREEILREEAPRVQQAMKTAIVDDSPFDVYIAKMLFAQELRDTVDISDQVGVTTAAHEAVRAAQIFASVIGNREGRR
jgi:hypothetical protein